jgi:hypothetical protein
LKLSPSHSSAPHRGDAENENFNHRRESERDEEKTFVSVLKLFHHPPVGLSNEMCNKEEDDVKQ